MTKTFCDICGKETSSGERVHVAIIATFSEFIVTNSVGLNWEGVDAGFNSNEVCMSCRSKLSVFIESLKEVGSDES